MPRVGQGGHDGRFTALVLGASVFVVYALTAARSRVSLDVWSANFASWHLVSTGTPWIDGLVIPPLENPLRHIWVVEAPNGHTVIGRSPGVVLAGLPAYLVSDRATMSLLPGAITAALLTAAAVVLMYRALTVLIGTRAAVVAALTLGLATPVWTVAANGLWPHTITVLGIAWMAHAASRGSWWVVGVAGGVVLWGRIHGVVLVAVFGLAMAAYLRRPHIAWRVGVPSAVALGLLCVWDRWMYGTFSPFASYTPDYFVDYASTHTLDLVNQLGLWVSPDRGILVWTPLILLLAPAAVRTWREWPPWCRALFLSGLAYTIVQGLLNRFSGGEAFYGYRLGLEFVACAVPGLAFSAVRAGRVVRAALGPAIGLMVGMMLPGAMYDVFVPLDRVWHDNALLKAFRSAPLRVGAMLVLCALIGLWAQLRVVGRRGAAPPERTSTLDPAGEGAG